MIEPPFTQRERDVLLALSDGKSNKQIAQQLGISIDAVANRLRSVYQRLGIRDDGTQEPRVMAVLWVWRHWRRDELPQSKRGALCRCSRLS